MIVAVATLARHLHTPIGEIEDMEMDRFEAYSKALDTILFAESGKPGRRKFNLPDGHESIAEQAGAVLDGAFAKHRAKEN
ncbi:hypothetical protein Nham_2375 [Nitrobacter hamburgensis X14]|uniref:Uncharacterized protein n=1 Tax=Nitrobacter hamburgensis (strain DSM 10229 / NCIMB 13809 / X14) TaxID=323097 RepID=Q1QKT1_NITHX|nr:hypothetical protein [Nitrobacter hamburgensis]ABE63166.1 hypothetical protein Nham_2375 [Nitrobacter hamburgensis X14]